jgi:hypothetical protein
MTFTIPMNMLFLLPVVLGFGAFLWMCKGHDSPYDIRPLFGIPFLVGGFALTVGLFLGRCV